MGKSKLARARSQGHSRKGRRVYHPAEGADSSMKVFIPKEYFKHAGYTEKSETASTIDQTRAQPRKPQIPFKERFNEKLEYP